MYQALSTNSSMELYLKLENKTATRQSSGFATLTAEFSVESVEKVSITPKYLYLRDGVSLII
jgi:hypothetical protein